MSKQAKTKKRTQWVSLSRAAKLLHMPPQQVEGLATDERWEMRLRPRADGIEESHFPLKTVQSKQRELDMIDEPGEPEVVREPEPMPAPASGLPVPAMEQLLVEQQRLGQAQVQTLARLHEAVDRMSPSDQLAKALESLADRDSAPSGGRGVGTILVVLLLVAGGAYGTVEYVRGQLEGHKAPTDKSGDAYKELAKDYRKGLEALKTSKDEDLDKQIASLRDTEARLTRELDGLKGIREHLGKQLSDRDKKIADLDRQLKEAIRTKATETAALKVELGRLRVEVAGLKKERKTLDAQVTKLAQQNARLRKRLERTLTPEEIRKLMNEDDLDK